MGTCSYDDWMGINMEQFAEYVEFAHSPRHAGALYVIAVRVCKIIMTVFSAGDCEGD